MENNSKISEVFREMADILELQDVKWKPIAYRRAAQSLESLDEDVSRIYKKGGIKKLEEIPNIGEKLALKIKEYLESGKIKAYEKLKRQVPFEVLELMKISGIGAKRIKKIFNSLKISNLEDLKKAIRLHKISKLPGFGEKSEKEILDAIKDFELSRGKRFSLKVAEKEAAKVVNYLKSMKNVKKVDVAGSLRRKKSTIGDLDILILCDDPNVVFNKFVKMKGIKDVLVKGHKKTTVILNSGMQVDVRAMPNDSYGAGLLYFTGNKNYNIMMRKLAIKKGYKLNEYGLFERKNWKKIAGKNEKEIFKILGLKYAPPEKREI